MAEGQKNPREVAEAYFKKHRIEPLCQRLCTRLVFYKPADPNQYLIGELKKVKENLTAGKNGLSCIGCFDEQDLDALFSILDPLKRGFITGDQAHTAFLTLGIPEELIGQKPDVFTKGHFTLVAQDLITKADERA